MRQALILLLMALIAHAHAQNVSSRITWVNKESHLEIQFVGAVPEGAKELPGSVVLYDKDDKQLWKTTAKIALEGEKPYAARVKLEKITKPDESHRVDVRFDRPTVALTYSEELHFAGEGQTVQSYGLRREGRFPDERAIASVTLNVGKKAGAKPVALGLTLRDADENVVLDKLVKIVVADQLAYYQVDVTPDKQSVGPYTLDYKIENDPLAIYFNTTRRFAFANALIPISSIEIDDTKWFAAGANPGYRTHALYYSPHLTQRILSSYPGLAYDSKVRHGGRQSLRIDYKQGERRTYVFSRQVLPGFPIMLRLWVKGNQTKDKLYVYWSDRNDLTRPAWQRNANFSRAFVCDMSFEGWRLLRAPVLGAGLQVKQSRAGSTLAVDAPIGLLALGLEPGSRPKRGEEPQARSIHIDDLLVETQARQDELMTMELRADDPEQRLHADTKLFVSVGSGSLSDIKDGRLSVIAKDRERKTVFSHTTTLPIGPIGFAVAEIPLGQAYEKSPLGPVDVDVSFVAPHAPGLRAAERIIFKHARSFGLAFDFEKPERYTSYDPTPERGQPWIFSSDAVSVVEGGAARSPHALRISVDPKAQASSAILHPALPGLVDRVKVLVKAGKHPVRLQPMFIDSGPTGIWLRDYNLFLPPAVEVNWQDWKEIEFAAPPPPAHYLEIGQYFWDKPCYPLNLVFSAKALGEEATEIFFDNVRVKTHLLADEELVAEIDFPDDSRLHPPGSPLELVLTNFAATPKKLSIHYQLDSLQQRTEAQGDLAVDLPAGQKVVRKLVESLRPGIYSLSVQGLEGRTIREYIQVVEPTQFFGAKPLDFLKDMPRLRKTLSMTVEKAYLDWDNVEAVPGLFHFHWFDVECKKVSSDGQYEITPVVGFSADWAGPHAQDLVAKGVYSRFMGNYLQVPVRMVDWSIFVRECLREFKGRFSHWTFWENPDLTGAPQGIPPGRYPEILRVFSKWVRLYDPKAKVVAGGFNIDKALDYLEGIERPAELEFDEIAVQTNIGELSPERAEVEGFLDELNDLLQLKQTGRKVQVTDLDWGIGEYTSPAQQAAYHTRALLILNSRGAEPHRFAFINSGEEFDGYGVFYRIPYGSSECIQTLKPAYVPKPAYFALVHTKQFLETWHFAKSVSIPDFNPQANRAFIYTNEAKQLTAVVWRTTGDERRYEVPGTWKGATARDAFGFPISLKDGLKIMGLPTFVELPSSYGVDQLAHDLRLLRAADGRDQALLDLHLAEADSCKRAGYSATGKTKSELRYGRIPGGRKVKEPFISGIEGERFEFSMAPRGDVLMSRRWFFGEEGQKLTVTLNDGPGQTWDLSKSKVNAPGVRESTFVLRKCAAGKNTVKIRYEKPGNCAGYRLERLRGNHVDLVQWGVFNAMQTKGELQKFTSASGTPLAIGKTRYQTGLGSHAVALIEYPLDAQFSAFEVTVGVDAVTDGRGSAIFEIQVDGAEKAKSDLMTGFSKPTTLKVENLEKARRLFLIVRDAGDSNQDDLANWVDGKLLLK